MEQVVDGSLVPIQDAARRFSVRASTLRYWEKCGLLKPLEWVAGRRWYGSDELRRIAIIRFWQQSGMSLEEIAQILVGSVGPRGWKQIVESRIDSLNAMISHMTVVRDDLEHMLTCPRENSRDGCPYFEDAIKRFDAKTL